MSTRWRRAPAWPATPICDGRIQDAIYRVLSYQSSAGSFGLWGPGSGDLWLDAYVTDFLTRAREQNYDVPAQAMNQALSNLQNAIGYDQDVKDRGSEIAYALYVLARNKKASIGDLRYYADTQLEAFTSPMAVAQLAAGLALYGDTQRSEATFQAAVQLANRPRHTTTTGPITARRCATAPRCWRSPPSSSRGRRSCRR